MADDLRSTDATEELMKQADDALIDGLTGEEQLTEEQVLLLAGCFVHGKRTGEGIDHQQSAGFQPADVEAGTGAVNMAFTSGSPGAPAVAGETLSDSIKGSHQHPKGSVFLFHNHVLVEAPVGHVGTAAQRESLTSIRGSVNVGKLFLFQAVALGWGSAALIPPDGAREQPVAGSVHNGLVDRSRPSSARGTQSVPW